jgi:hypothetical protein
MNEPVRREGDLCVEMDKLLSAIHFYESGRTAIWEKIEGVKPMKKRFSFVLAMAVFVLAACGAAAAAITLFSTGRQVLESEREYGYYEDWPTRQKIELVRALVQQGFIEQTPALDRLLTGAVGEEEAHRMTDDALISFTKQKVSDISFMIIMEAALGLFDEWTIEQQAWYSRMMIDMELQKDDHTLYVLPKDERINQDMAIQIAKREVSKGFSVSEDWLSEYEYQAQFYVSEDHAQGDNQPWWRIYISPTDMVSDDTKLFDGFMVRVHPETGELMESVEHILARQSALQERLKAEFSHPIYSALKALSDQADSMPLWARTLEQKAEYSRIINPILKTILDGGNIAFTGQLDNYLIAASTFTYGLPGSEDMPLEQALRLAVITLTDKFGMHENIAQLYRGVYTHFDITDPDKPLWKFHFYPETWKDFEGGLEDPLYRLRYKVVLDARTGDVVSAKEFAFKPLDGTDLAYELNWY